MTLSRHGAPHSLRRIGHWLGPRLGRPFGDCPAVRQCQSLCSSAARKFSSSCGRDTVGTCTASHASPSSFTRQRCRSFPWPAAFRAKAVFSSLPRSARVYASATEQEDPGGDVGTQKLIINPICGGCGVRLQRDEPNSPGFFQVPKVKQDVVFSDYVEEVEEDEEDDDFDFSTFASSGDVEDEDEDTSWIQNVKNPDIRAILERLEGKDTSYDPEAHMRELVASRRASKKQRDEHSGEDMGDIMAERIAMAEADEDAVELDLERDIDTMFEGDEEDDDRDDDLYYEYLTTLLDQEKKKRRKTKREWERQKMARHTEASKGRVVVCQRCHGLRHYGRVKNETSEALLPDFDFARVLGNKVRYGYQFRRAIFLIVVDLVDFDGSFPRSAVRIINEIEERRLAEAEASGSPPPRHPLQTLVVGTKQDLLPRKSVVSRLRGWVRKRSEEGGADVEHVHVVSAKTGYGIKELQERLRTQCAGRGDVFVVGAQNSGKSSLINAMKRQYTGLTKLTEHVTEAIIPGTTIGVLRVDGAFSGGKLFDTPGILHPHQVTTRLPLSDVRMLLPKAPLKPRTYRIERGYSILVGGIAKIDVLDIENGRTIYVTLWVSGDISLHMGKTEKADGVLSKHLGGKLQPPRDDPKSVTALGRPKSHTVTVIGSSWRESTRDIALAGIGWAAIGAKGGARFRVSAPRGVGITERRALIPDYAHDFCRPGFTEGFKDKK